MAAIPHPGMNLIVPTTTGGTTPRSPMSATTPTGVTVSVITPRPMTNDGKENEDSVRWAIEVTQRIEHVLSFFQVEPLIDAKTHSLETDQEIAATVSLEDRRDTALTFLTPAEIEKFDTRGHGFLDKAKSIITTAKTVKDVIARLTALKSGK
jgi:hypothetical protein